MNIAAIVQSITTAVLTYLATKGLHLDAHAQMLLVGGLTLVASWVLPTVVRWSHPRTREIGAAVGALAVAAQILVSLNLGGEVQALVTSFIALLAGLGIPAAAHEKMPAPPAPSP